MRGRGQQRLMVGGAEHRVELKAYMFISKRLLCGHFTKRRLMLRFYN